MMYPVTGMVLAGGKSSRMGVDKALLPLQDQNFLGLRINYLKPLFDEVMLVVDRPGKYHFEGVSEAYDLFTGKGPLGGIHAGLLAARHDWAFVTACDMPYWDVSLVEKLLAERGDEDIVVPRYNGKLEPLLALYRKSCVPAIEDLIKQQHHRIHDLFQQVKTKIVVLDDAESEQTQAAKLFVNVNTPDDYLKLKKSCPVLSIVARSGTGKTTLLEKLIPELKSRGLRLAIIKHDRHQFEMDHEGKDTWKFSRAGADIVAISSPDKFALIEKPKKEQSLDDIIARINGVDLILTEGYKYENKPKIEIYRSAVCTELISPAHELVAVASDVPLDLAVPCIDLSDIGALADEVLRFVEKQNSLSPVS